MEREEALDRIAEIQRVMERATRYTLLPGGAAIVGGLMVLAGCALSWWMVRSLDFAAMLQLSVAGQAGFCLLWFVIGVAGIVLEAVLTARAARREGLSTGGRSTRLALVSLSPSVLVAMLLGVASQLLPFAERNPDRVASWLSERAGRPVSFDRVQTRWTRRGPLLQLDNLRIGNGAQGFTIGDTEMLVSLYAGLLPGQSFSELRLRGLDLTLERADDGRWSVRGLPNADNGGDPLDALRRLGELQVRPSGRD